MSVFMPFIEAPVYALLGIYGFVGGALFVAVLTAQVACVAFAPIGGAIYTWRSRAAGTSSWGRFLLGSAYFAALVAPWIYLLQQTRREIASRPKGEPNLRWAYAAWITFLIVSSAPIIASGFLNTAGATPAWLLVSTSLFISATIYIFGNKRLSRRASVDVPGPVDTARKTLSGQQVYVRICSYISATIVSVPTSWMILGFIFN